MIATYPNFSKLDLSHREQIQRHTARFAPYSDFNFTSLFCWNTDGTTEVAMLNDNLVIRMPDYLDGHLVYSLLGDNQIDESVELLLETAGKLELVPEVVVQALQQTTRYKITEDEDNHDYVYELDHLAAMLGGKFKKKRNKINIFISEHQHYELSVKFIDRLDGEHRELLRQLDRHWATLSTRDEGDILAERTAIDTLLDNSDDFNLIITEVWVNGVMKAFSINEKLSDEYGICHFEKALKAHHEHLNTFLVPEVAKHLKDAGCRLVNWEQDLGLEGLRRSKSSYHPAFMLKKYTVALVHTTA